MKRRKKNPYTDSAHTCAQLQHQNTNNKQNSNDLDVMWRREETIHTNQPIVDYSVVVVVLVVKNDFSKEISSILI